MPKRRQREHDEERRRADRRDDRMAKRRAQDGAPDARLLPVALEALQERSPVASASTSRRGSRRSTRMTPAASTASTPRSIRSPSSPSSAGSTVSEPTIDMKTTIIAPIPSDVKIFEPASSMPAIAISTVTPETSTAWPEVAAARCSASRPVAARRPLLALALHVEERVVDADRHADQQDHGARRVRRRARRG